MQRNETPPHERGTTARKRPRAVPRPTPETARFWDGTAQEELWIQRCSECTRAYFYPRGACPHCSSRAVKWFRCSGDATLYSYVIECRAAPGFEDDLPYVVAVVTLEEGPRMMTNIVDVDPVPELLTLDMALTVKFRQQGEVKIPVFAPRMEKQ